MKKLYIIANWKSYKTTEDAKSWLENFKNEDLELENKEVIVCPPFTLLPMMQKFIKENNLPVKLGSQNISPFPEGAYTGEINAKQIREFAEYVIIGHSERRSNFQETDEMLAKKSALALEAGLTPIFCVQNDEIPVPADVAIVAYEPVWAIGSGNPDTPENAEKVSEKIKQKNKVDYVLYGGSVKPENINGFTKMPSIYGALIGGASLDPNSFSQIIKNS